MNREEIRNLLDYNIISGEFTWKAGRRKGCKAGYVHDSDEYVRISIKNKPYYAHRLAFLYMLGYVPQVVDHINHCSSDNRWINLSNANPVSNMQNKSVMKNNKSGVTGVCFENSRSKWKSYIKVNGKNITIGRYASKEEAIAARKKADVDYGFHKNHGKIKYDI